MSVPKGRTKKVVGILGGMGPEATADLFMKIIRATPATTDQEHLRVIIDSNASIPDRTAFIEGRGPDPVPYLIETARNLDRAGAEIIVMPCNTAHYFYDQVQAAISVPMLHMMREAARAGRRLAETARASLTAGGSDQPAGPVRVGILATDGTIKTGLYHRALVAEGLEPLTPLAEDQRQVMEAIYVDGLKAQRFDRPRGQLTQAAEGLVARGAELILAGCTEFPLVLRPGMVSRPIIDPTQALAEAAVRKALDFIN